MLAQARKAVGGALPKLSSYMAESPELLDGYRQLRALFGKTSFSRVEQELILLTINFEHDCEYCMAAHSMRATKVKMAPEVLAALRRGEPVPDVRLEALHRFTRTMVLDRARVTDAETQAFLDAGYTRQNILEVVLGIASKVLTNYSNHFFDAPLNDFLKPFEWSKPSARP